MGLSYSTIDSLQHQHVALYLTSLTLRVSLATWTTHVPQCYLAYYSPPAVHVWLATCSIYVKASQSNKSVITPCGWVVLAITECPWLHVALCCHSHHLHFYISTEQCRINCLVFSPFLCIRTLLNAVSSSSACTWHKLLIIMVVVDGLLLSPVYVNLWPWLILRNVPCSQSYIIFGLTWKWPSQNFRASFFNQTDFPFRGRAADRAGIGREEKEIPADQTKGR